MEIKVYLPSAIRFGVFFLKLFFMLGILLLVRCAVTSCGSIEFSVIELFIKYFCLQNDMENTLLNSENMVMHLE